MVNYIKILLWPPTQDPMKYQIDAPTNIICHHQLTNNLIIGPSTIDMASYWKLYHWSITVITLSDYEEKKALIITIQESRCVAWIDVSVEYNTGSFHLIFDYCIFGNFRKV